MDLNGKLIYKSVANSPTILVDVPKVSNGFYYLEIVNPSGNAQRTKFLVNR
ncbi:MAG: T9SS type A sorting domain-containing protein [Crocinitomicaceae bacterium]